MLDGPRKRVWWGVSKYKERISSFQLFSRLDLIRKLRELGARDREAEERSLSDSVNVVAMLNTTRRLTADE